MGHQFINPLKSVIHLNTSIHPLKDNIHRNTRFTWIQAFKNSIIIHPNMGSKQVSPTQGPVFTRKQAGNITWIWGAQSLPTRTGRITSSITVNCSESYLLETLGSRFRETICISTSTVTSRMRQLSHMLTLYLLKRNWLVSKIALYHHKHTPYLTPLVRRNVAPDRALQHYA